MTHARITATEQQQCQRVVLRLSSPEAGTLSILSIAARDPYGPARAAAWMASAEDLVASGALDVLSIDPDGAEVLARHFGV